MICETPFDQAPQGCGDNRRQQELHQQGNGAGPFLRQSIAVNCPDFADKVSGKSEFQDNLSAAGSWVILSGVIGADGELRTGCGELVLGEGRPSRFGEDPVQGGKHD